MKIRSEDSRYRRWSYVRAGNSEFGLNPIIDHIKEMDEQEFQSVVFEDFDEQYMYFFAIALFFPNTRNADFREERPQTALQNGG